MNNLAIITGVNPVEIRLKATAQELCETAQDVVIFTRNDLSCATDLVKTIKTRYKEIEDERKRIVDPFNAGVKQINARFKAMTAPLEDAETFVKGKMLSFQREEEKRAHIEQERLDKIRRESDEKSAKEATEQSNGDDIRSMAMPVAFAEISTPIHKPTTYGQTGAVSTVKKVWAFELVDIQALAASRPDLVSVDATKINQEIRGKGGEIPGLRIYENEIIQVR